MVTLGAAELLVLERRWSPERLAPYRAACGGDLAAAVALYRWNAEISAALGTTLGHVEILLRNALHEELTAWSLRCYGEPRWYLDLGGVLTDEGRRDVVKARSRATRDGRPETPGRVVAELNLGFWRFLLATRYDATLWRACLHRAVSGQRRRTVHAAVSRLHEARNRMAHHEPMFNRPVADLRATAVEVAGWLCPVTRDWIDRACRVLPLLADRPRTVLPHPRR
ncbi:Abi family protein [Micromonospora sp. KC721]|uniref:Abi family protein n=1 Tax=Micromonospora sp. KC721 TaxID=2530380 RepID=UPI001A9FA22C|nr:Abi family protein [Micromonospora sp. KC721]